MTVFNVPYGKRELTCHLPDGVPVDVIEPAQVAAAEDPLGVVEAALDAPLGAIHLTVAPQSMGIWLGVVLGLTTLASVIPARRAARLTIREVLAYE